MNSAELWDVLWWLSIIGPAIRSLKSRYDFTCKYIWRDKSLLNGVWYSRIVVKLLKSMSLILISVGEWGEWQNATSCSRSCGGGILTQIRDCHQVRICFHQVTKKLSPGDKKIVTRCQPTIDHLNFCLDDGNMIIYNLRQINEPQNEITYNCS